MSLITPVSNPNTITTDGQTVFATNWTTNFNTIYNYVNNNLVAAFNQMQGKGDIITNNGSSVQAFSATGVTDGFVLSKDSTQTLGLKWISPPGLPTTTEGDLIYYHSGTNTRLPIGANGLVLSSNGTDPIWATAPSSFTSGMILLWSGSIASIPAGWVLCDGTNSTPNLQGLFVVGAGATSPAATGGMGLMNPGGPFGDNSAGAGLGPAHTHVAGGGNTGLAAGTNANLSSTTITPRYFALCYIMKS